MSRLLVMPADSPNVLRLLRESHEERVLTALRTYGALSRSELCRRTSLSRATLSSIVRRLLAVDAVVELPSEPGPTRTRGRPVTLLTLNPTGGLALGMDLGHRRIHVAIANVAHEVVASDGTECAERTPWRKRIDIALGLVDSLTERHSLSLAALGGVGVGVVGPVSETGTPGRSARPDRTDLIRDRLTERFDVPIHLDNNTRLAALAEAIWGAGAGIQNVLYIRLSYGVGGGLVLSGQLFSGADGGAGEFGHVCVDPEGPRCHCGSRGCLERYVSVGAILERCRTRHFDDALGRLTAGDPGVREVIEQAGHQVGRVLAASSAVVNPEVVVIGGELTAAGDALLRPVHAAIHTYAHRKARRRLRIYAATLGHEGAARGGTALVLRRSALLAGYPATPHDSTTERRRDVADTGSDEHPAAHDRSTSVGHAGMLREHDV